MYTATNTAIFDPDLYEVIDYDPELQERKRQREARKRARIERERNRKKRALKRIIRRKIQWCLDLAFLLGGFYIAYSFCYWITNM